MPEPPFAAFPVQHILFVPALCEQHAVPAQLFDQCLHVGVRRPPVEVGPEFRRQPPCPRVPVHDQLTRGRVQEDVTEEVAVGSIRVQPADKERGRGIVPGPCRPRVVQQIGGRGHQPRQGQQGG
jgi:hypothetical protein